MARCNAIEADLGRERSVQNAPRPIDLDILLFGEQVVHRADLTIPHPRMHERRFVLEPFSEIAPSIVHPTLKVSVETLLVRLDSQTDGCRRITPDTWATRPPGNRTP